MTMTLARTAGLVEERRGLTLAQARPDVRESDDGTKRFVGHAAVFDVRTAIGNPLTWGFYEQVAPGAFTKTLSEGDARMLIDHDSYYVVSRVSADTLSLAQDKVGLLVASALDTDLSYVGDLIVNLRNKNITGMSFGFYVVKADWSEEDVETSDGQSATVEIRTIREVKLVEVSAVTFPAYEETDAGLRHSLIPALRQRADAAAIERRAKYRPELIELLGEFTKEDELARAAKRLGYELSPIQSGEPAETTRDDTPAADVPEDGDGTTDEGDDTEPAASTRLAPSIGDRMRALQKRYRLPAA